MALTRPRPRARPGRRLLSCPDQGYRWAADGSSRGKDVRMGVGRRSGGDYDLSDPVGSFVDVVRRVVLQPAAFFAGLPRQGSLVNPLMFALICTEISVILVGLLTFVDVPGGAL